MTIMYLIHAPWTNKFLAYATKVLDSLLRVLSAVDLANRCNACIHRAHWMWCLCCPMWLHCHIGRVVHILGRGLLDVCTCLVKSLHTMFVLLVELFARPHVSLCLYTRLVGLLEDLQSLLRSIVLRSVVGACSRDIVRINCFHTASCKWA